MPPQGDIVRVPSSSDSRNVGSPSRREINSENHVWEGQNRATRRRRSPHVFTLRSTAGISLTGGKHTASCLARGALAHLSPERWVREGEPKGALVRLLQRKEVPLCCAESFPNLIHRTAVQHPFPYTWASVLTRSSQLGSRPLGHEPLSGTKTCPVT